MGEAVTDLPITVFMLLRFNFDAPRIEPENLKTTSVADAGRSVSADFCSFWPAFPGRLLILLGHSIARKGRDHGTGLGARERVV